MIALEDIIELEGDDAWLAGLSPVARETYGALLDARDRWGYVAPDVARSALCDALGPQFREIDSAWIEQRRELHGRGSEREVANAIREGIARNMRKAGIAYRVLTELDESGIVVVGAEPVRARLAGDVGGGSIDGPTSGLPWRVWTREEAREAQEVFG